MAALASPSPPPSPTRMPRRWARKAERYCWQAFTYFPLLFVYSITTWAVWVEVDMGSRPNSSGWIGNGTSLLGMILYGMLIWSYTTAVFTSPGTTTGRSDGYSTLPTYVPANATSFTVKSNGELRYCKKCEARKPDRAHHCSTCGKCVLKMDHHCPWLATCVGLRNYKAFLLFLIYTTLFCLLCSAVSGVWVWSEILSDGQFQDSLMPVNYVMLAVISSIIGLVLGGFTIWHIMLSARGQTTIECLEKTRYLSPLRQAMKHQHITEQDFSQHSDGDGNYAQQLKEIHTNRAEEGEDSPYSGPHPGQQTQQNGRMNYEAMERYRERRRYQEYLDEQDSSKLPNAFDLGWRRNLLHLFGPNRLLWALPMCTTTGNGWSWDPSPKWLDARERIRVEREQQRMLEHRAGWGPDPESVEEVPVVQTRYEPPRGGAGRHYVTSPPERMTRPRGMSKADRVLGRGSKADRILGREVGMYSDTADANDNMVPLRDLRPRRNGVDDIDDFEGDEYETSSDEEDRQRLRSSITGGLGVSNVQHGVQHGMKAGIGLLGKIAATQRGGSSGGWSAAREDDDGVD